MNFLPVQPFVIFDRQTSEHMPTKPFGVPYRIAVIDEEKNKGIVSDSFDGIMELWIESYSLMNKEKKDEKLLNLGKAIATQLQAHELKNVQTGVLTPSDIETILKVSNSIETKIEWDHKITLYALSNEENNYFDTDQDSKTVRFINIKDSINFVKTLESIGLIKVFTGQIPDSKLMLES